MKPKSCIYTNKDAKAKDSVLPKDLLGDELHNWTAQVPVNIDYLQTKQGRQPTELEMQANEYFHLLELARLRVKFYEAKLSDIQTEILKDYKEPVRTRPVQSERIKEEQIKKAIVEKQAVETATQSVDTFFENKRRVFDDDET